MHTILWNSVLVLVGALVLILVSALSIHEHTRWLECSKTCGERTAKNSRILISDVCKTHASGSAYYGDDARTMCERAQQENELSQFSCTAREYWKTSELNRLYSMYAESHWMLFGLTAICLLFIIHQVFASWNEKRLQDRMEGMYRDTLKQLPQPMIQRQKQQVLMIEEEEEKMPTRHGRSKSIGSGLMVHQRKAQRPALVPFARPFTPPQLKDENDGDF